MSSPESAHLPEVRMTRKRPKMVPLHTLVESETLERIDRIAKSRGLSRAAFLRRLFLGIERVEPEPPPR